MIRLSSNATLFFKLVLPIFFGVFYGLLSIFFLGMEQNPFPDYIRYSNLIFYLAVLFILYKTVIQLLRVDCGADHFIVTNYRTAYKYNYDAIESFRCERLLWITLGTIRFKSPSSFGPTAVFLVDVKRLAEIKHSFGEVFPEMD